jgi:hypothetical protein
VILITIAVHEPDRVATDERDARRRHAAAARDPLLEQVGGRVNAHAPLAAQTDPGQTEIL